MQEDTRKPLPHWHNRADQGVFMGGVVMKEGRSKCPCGGTFAQTSFRFDKVDYRVPKCTSCQAFPDRFKIRQYVPSMDAFSAGQTVDIRYDSSGERLTDVITAIVTLKQVEKEIKDKDFDPVRYGSTAMANHLQFSNYVEKRYLPAQKKCVERGDLKQASYRSKDTLYRCHLRASFGEMDLRKINSASILTWHEGYTEKLRMRDKARDELKCILEYAYRHGHLKQVPKFPKGKSSRTRNAENFLSPQELELVCSKVDSPIYYAMIKTLWLYAMRPSEMRALQWRDIDYKQGVLVIQRHFSDGDLVEGRKSQNGDEGMGEHHLPLLPEFLGLIKGFPRSLRRTDFIFSLGAGKPVSAMALNEAWHRARTAAGIRHIQLYEATRHSRLSYLKKLGWTDEQLLSVSGHTSTEMLKRRYAKLKKADHVRQAMEVLSGCVLGAGDN